MSRRKRVLVARGPGRPARDAPPAADLIMPGWRVREDQPEILDAIDTAHRLGGRNAALRTVLDSMRVPTVRAAFDMWVTDGGDE